MFYTVSEVLLKPYTTSNKSLARYISAVYEKKDTFIPLETSFYV